jgi:hypothetical protein
MPRLMGLGFRLGPNRSGSVDQNWKRQNPTEIAIGNPGCTMFVRVYSDEYTCPSGRRRGRNRRVEVATMLLDINFRSVGRALLP